jgi:hypothetical protein
MSHIKCKQHHAYRPTTQIASWPTRHITFVSRARNDELVPHVPSNRRKDEDAERCIRVRAFVALQGKDNDVQNARSAKRGDVQFVESRFAPLKRVESDATERALVFVG